MSDDDMVAHESGDAGASTWYPGEAGQVKKSGHILMKGDKPCKVRPAASPPQRESSKKVEIGRLSTTGRLFPTTAAPLRPR